MLVAQIWIGGQPPGHFVTRCIEETQRVCRKAGVRYLLIGDDLARQVYRRAISETDHPAYWARSAGRATKFLADLVRIQMAMEIPDLLYLDADALLTSTEFPEHRPGFGPLWAMTDNDTPRNHAFFVNHDVLWFRAFREWLPNRPGLAFVHAIPVFSHHTQGALNYSRLPIGLVSHKDATRIPTNPREIPFSKQFLPG